MPHLAAVAERTPRVWWSVAAPRAGPSRRTRPPRSVTEPHPAMPSRSHVARTCHQARTAARWRRAASPATLKVMSDLRVLEVRRHLQRLVETDARAQAKRPRRGAVLPGAARGHQAGAHRAIQCLFKRHPALPCDLPQPRLDIRIQGHRGTHISIIASALMLS